MWIHLVIKLSSLCGWLALINQVKAVLSDWSFVIKC